MWYAGVNTKNAPFQLKPKETKMANTIEVPDTIPSLVARLGINLTVLKKRLKAAGIPSLAEQGLLKDMDDLLDLMWLELNRHQKITLEQTTQYLRNNRPIET